MGIMDTMNNFSTVKGLASRRPYDKVGHYLYIIEGVNLANSFQQGGEYVAIEKTIVRVISADPTKEAGKVGDQVVDLIFSTGKQGKVFWQKLKSFLCGVLNEKDETKITENELKMALSPAQPLKNMLIEMRNTPRFVVGDDKQRKEVVNKDYVRGYSPAEAKAILTPEEVAKFYPNGLLDQMIAAAAA